MIGARSPPLTKDALFPLAAYITTAHRSTSDSSLFEFTPKFFFGARTSVSQEATGLRVSNVVALPQRITTGANSSFLDNLSINTTEGRRRHALPFGSP